MDALTTETKGDDRLDLQEFRSKRQRESGPPAGLIGLDPHPWASRHSLQVKAKALSITLMVFGAVAILADLANFFPNRAGSYAIAGAILIAAGVLVKADN